MPSTKGPSTWEGTGENIPDDMYTMKEFDNNNIEDGKTGAKNPSNNSTSITTSSPKSERSFHIQSNEANFCNKYDSDSKNGPFVPERIMVKTV